MTTMQPVQTQPRTARAPEDHPTPAWVPGVVLGGAAAIASRMTSLVPRHGWQNWATMAASAGVGFGLGTGINAGANALDRHSDSLGGATSKLLVTGAGVAAALGSTVALRGHSSNTALQAIRSGGIVTALAGTAGLAVEGERALGERLGDWSRSGTGGAVGSGAAALGFGAVQGGAVVAGAVALLTRNRSTAVSREVAAIFEAEMASKIPGPTTFDPARWAKLTAERAELTTVSGGPGSLLPRDVLNGEAKRFVDNVTTPQEIARVMGTEGAPIQAPVRAYGSIKHAGSHQEIADKLLAETKRLGGFDRSHLVLYVPSGTGNINQQTVMSLEYLHRGDITSIGMQYGELPSVQSLFKVKDAAKLFDTIRATFVDHIATLPEHQRPKVYGFGESLGSLGLQEAIRSHGGHTKVNDLGIDRILNVGTPGFSKLREAAIGQQGHKLDPSGTLFEFGLMSELERLPAAQRANVDTFLFSHYDDAVNRANLKTLYAKPPWLANRTDGLGIEPRMKWMPGITGVHSIFDLINGISSGPGRAHNYGINMPEATNAVFETGATPKQIGGIVEAVEQLRIFESQPKAKA